MNVAAIIQRPKPVKLTVDDFLLLKRAHAFAGYSKVELLQGELSGVPLQDEDEPESDASVPIRLRVEDYDLLAREGALAKFGKTELIDGLVYRMSPQYSLHAHVKGLLFRRLADACDVALPGHHVWTEVSVAIPPNDMREPDIVVASFEPSARAPVPAETVALVIEVAETTARYDLGGKARLYAFAGIPEYWVVDVEKRVIHQMWSPGAEDYAERREVAFGERVAAVTIAGVAVETKGLTQ